MPSRLGHFVLDGPVPKNKKTVEKRTWPISSRAHVSSTNYIWPTLSPKYVLLCCYVLSPCINKVILSYLILSYRTVPSLHTRVASMSLWTVRLSKIPSHDWLLHESRDLLTNSQDKLERSVLNVVKRSDV